MEQQFLTLENLCRFCLSNKCDSLVALSERHSKQYRELTRRILPLNDYYPQNACIQCCNDLENLYSYKNLLIQRQDELDIILQSCSIADQYVEECTYDDDDVIEEYLDDFIEEKTYTAQEKPNTHEMPSVKNFSHKPDTNDILKLIEDIEKNNQIIFESSKPKVLMKKRKTRAQKLPKVQQTLNQPRNDALLIEIPEPKLILKPIVLDSDEKKKTAGIVVYREKHICTICNESFNSEFLLKRHNNSHPLEHPIMCCDKVFEMMDDYKKHKQSEHSQTIICKCGKILKNQKTYRIHLKSHLALSERKYKCNKANCSKAFNMKVHLENHLRTHNNENPFACHICKSFFKQKYQVTLHLRNKHNINSNTNVASETSDSILE